MTIWTTVNMRCYTLQAKTNQFRVSAQDQVLQVASITADSHEDIIILFAFTATHI